MALKEKATGWEPVAAPPPPPPPRSLPASDRLRLPALPALLLLGLAVYVTLYMSDLWGFGRIQLAPRVFYPGPVPYLAFAAVIGLGLSWYGAAPPPAAFAGAAVLFALLSLISIGQSSTTQQLIGSLPRDVLALWVTAVSLTVSVLTSASVMLVVGVVAPALRKLSYWLIALILWPIAGMVIFSIVPAVTMSWLDRSSLPHLFFAALLLRQCIIFGCIGYWLDSNTQRLRAVARQFE